MKSVAQTSFRDYLRGCLEAEKIKGRPASLRAFSARLGMSESSLRMILAGERNLTIHNIHAIAEALKLSVAQTEIFEALVLRDQAATEAEKKYYGKRLRKKVSEYRLTDKAITETSVLKDWFGPALLIFLRERGITKESMSEAEMQRLAASLGISTDRLSKVLDRFTKLGLLDGARHISEHHTYDKVTTHSAQMEHVKHCLEMAMKKVDSDYRSGRSLFSIKSLSLLESERKAFAQEYKSLLERYMAKSAVSPAESASDRQVIQIAFAALRVL